MELDLAIAFFQALGTYIISYILARVGFHGRDLLQKGYWEQKKEIISAFPSISHLHLNKRKSRARVISDSYDDDKSMFSDFHRGINECKRAIESAEKFHNTLRMISTGVILSLIYVIFYFAMLKNGSDWLDLTVWQSFTAWAVFFGVFMIYPNVQRSEIIKVISTKHEELVEAENFKATEEKIYNG